MTRRLLPAAEWSKLAGTELGAVWHALDPATAYVVVVEDGDAIVGCWLAFPQWHLEGCWVAPQHRKRGRVFPLLLDTMRGLLQGLGAKTVMTASVSAEVTHLLAHLEAVKLPGDHYVVTVKES
jgi:hypothetical protein